MEQWHRMFWQNLSFAENQNIFTVYFRNDDSYSGGINSVVLYFGKLGIMNNYPVLILLYAAFCFPMTILILTGFMNGIPTELEEAMVIDGANIYQVFLR